MASKLGNFIKVFLSYHRFVGLLLIAGAICYMIMLSDPRFNNRCYISEKALSPGVVEEQFTQVNFINDYFAEVKKLYTIENLENGKFQKWLEEEMTKIGLDAYTQNFTFSYPLILGEKKLNGINAVGISRAYRAARTEALVLMTPLRGADSSASNERRTEGSVALMLALAKFFRRQTHWAKDTIFLFTEMETIGLQAWLHAYHGESDLLKPTIAVSEPAYRSGSIQAAVSLEFSGVAGWERARLHVEGVNGVLPNLDLVNTVVRIAGKHGVRLQLHGADRQPALLLRSLLYQASGSPSSLHGLFLPFDIPAVGLSGEGRASTGATRTAGAVVEAVWRSLNNLQERFHQSFFFYALPAMDRYVSIGDYTPPLGVMLLALALAAIDSLVVGFGDGDASTKPKSGGGGLVGPVVRLCAMAACFGVLALCGPAYFIRTAAAFRIDPGAGMLIGLLSVQAMAAAFPLMFPNLVIACHPGALRLCASLFMGLSLGALSLVNFGMAFLAACPLTPVCLLAGGPDKLARPLRLLVASLALLAGSPLSLLLAGCWAAGGNERSLLSAWTCAEYGALQGYVEGQLLGSFTYRLSCLMLLPCWLLAWCQLFARAWPLQVKEAEKDVQGESKTDAETTSSSSASASH